MVSSLEGRERYMVWRKRHRVRLVDIAKYCGCFISAISQWENNQINLSDQLLAKYNEFIREFEKIKI